MLRVAGRQRACGAPLYGMDPCSPSPAPAVTLAPGSSRSPSGAASFASDATNVTASQRGKTFPVRSDGAQPSDIRRRDSRGACLSPNLAEPEDAHEPDHHHKNDQTCRPPFHRGPGGPAVAGTADDPEENDGGGFANVLHASHRKGSRVSDRREESQLCSSGLLDGPTSSVTRAAPGRRHCHLGAPTPPAIAGGRTALSLPQWRARWRWCPERERPRRSPRSRPSRCSRWPAAAKGAVAEQQGSEKADDGCGAFPPRPHRRQGAHLRRE